FDFTEMNGNPIAESKKAGKMDPKSALRKLQAQKGRLEALKEKGKEDRVKEIQENVLWESALSKAEGQKLKDDEGLLKKTVKKMESRKKSTKRKWDKRVDDEDRRKDASQKKRTENIQKRKKEKKDRKIKKAVKRGRAVPGFT
ncbi:Surfeit locus protein 6 -like protein, partial [Caligus rogercresseyi]